MRQIVLAMATSFTLIASAQAPARQGVPTDAVTIVPAAQLQKLLQSAPVSEKTGEPGDLSTQLFARAASCSFIRLAEPDAPHVHPVSEIYVMQEGSAVLETGGTMIGPFTNGGVHHQPAPGQGPQAQEKAEAIGPDHGGTKLEGGHSQEVKAGDVLLIPAGVNHHWTKVSQSLVYLDIKFPKPE